MAPAGPADSAASPTPSVADSDGARGEQARAQAGAGPIDGEAAVPLSQQAADTGSRQTTFDRTVSLLIPDSIHASSMAASRSSRWRGKMSSSYVRRAVSARFAGGARRLKVATSNAAPDGEEGSEEGSEQELAQSGGKGGPKRGKSGAFHLAARCVGLTACSSDHHPHTSFPPLQGG